MASEDPPSRSRLGQRHTRSERTEPTPEEGHAESSVDWQDARAESAKATSEKQPKQRRLRTNSPAQRSHHRTPPARRSRHETAQELAVRAEQTEPLRGEVEALREQVEVLHRSLDQQVVDRSQLCGKPPDRVPPTDKPEIRYELPDGQRLCPDFQHDCCSSTGPQCEKGLHRCGGILPPGRGATSRVCGMQTHGGQACSTATRWNDVMWNDVPP